MKFKNSIAVIAIAVFINTSCNNDLKILAPYKNITVVYGLLDQNDPIHYIRINKAFEGNGNAYTMAQQYDSIYYPIGTISAVIEDSSLITNTIVNTYKLDTITTIPLGPGTFSYPKQLLYYTNATLNPNDIYNLIVTNNKTGQKYTGSTPLLSDIQFAGSSSTFATDNTFYLSFSNAIPSQISWTTTVNVRIYQMTIIFYYDELYQSSRTAKSINWVFSALTAPNLSGNSIMSYSLTAPQLYSLIAYSMSPQSGVTRMQDSIGVIFTSGSDDLNTYVQLSQPPSGINQDVPSFSDIKNGVGLFTCRHIQNFNKQLAQLNLDSLYSGSQTGNLGFVPYQP
jgi:hypothetical protein